MSVPAPGNILSPETRRSLVENVRLGDVQAFGQLYDAYSPALMGLLYRMTGDEKRSEEVLQQIFVQAWQEMQAPGFRHEDLFTRLASLARTLANPPIEVKAEVLTGEDNPKALELVYFKGYGHKEAARLLNLTVAELKTRIRMELNVYRGIMTK